MAGAAGAVARGPRLDHRGGAPDPRAGDEHPGAAQPAARRAWRSLIRAGINDWGGVSPVTPDHVNPEAPWPHLADLDAATERAGRTLVERLAIYPEFMPARAAIAVEWRLEPGSTPLLRTPVTPPDDGVGSRARMAGRPALVEPLPRRRSRRIRESTASGQSRRRSPTHPRSRRRRRAELGEADIVALFEARGRDFAAVCRAADGCARAQRRHRHLRRQPQHQLHQHLHLRLQVLRLLQGPAQPRPSREALRSRPRRDRARARARPGRAAPPRCACRAASGPATRATPISRIVDGGEVGGARHARARLLAAGGLARRRRRLGLPLHDYLARLKAAGLGSLPGTAAEILDDEVRAVLCPDKITTAQWLEVMETAHAVGLRSTATIMFGHVDGYRHWARHLLRVRALQEQHRRLHRVRAAALRAHGGADLPQGPGAQGPDVPRGGADARGGAAGARSGHPQHPGLLGEDGPRRRGAVPRRPAATTWAAC